MSANKIDRVTYSERIQKCPEYLALTKDATVYLDELLQSCKPRIPGKWPVRRVSAEWDLGTDDRGRNVLTLHIWDEDAQARGQFTPDELKMPPIRDHRLWRIWDDLLREDIEKRLVALMEDGNNADN